MKHFITSILLSATFAVTTFAQQEFAPGWYIIQSTAKYSVVSPSGAAMINKGEWKDTDAWGNTLSISESVIENLLIKKAGEVVFAFEYSGGKVYCFDPSGGMLVFDGLSSLKKATIVQGCGVGNMLESIPLLDGSTLQEDSYYWIIGQDIANSTFKIEVQDGKTYHVPQEKINLYSVNLKNMMKSKTFESVE